MSLTIKGRLAQKLTKETVNGKNGKTYDKMTFVIDTGDRHNSIIAFGLFGDKTALVDNITIGQEIEVSFNLSSREYNGKFYTQADCWKVSKVGDEQIVRSVTTPQLESSILRDIKTEANDGENLPF